MNKQQLVDAVAQNTGMTKKDSVSAVSAILDVITETLASGEDVKITGFGSFEVKTREARTGRNPKTKEQITIQSTELYPINLLQLLDNLERSIEHGTFATTL